MMIYYNHVKKKLGLEVPESVKVPRKIARRITMLATKLKNRDNKEN